MDIDWDTEQSPLHANAILAVQTHVDSFAVVFADALPVTTRFREVEGKKNPVLFAPIVVSLRIPASAMGAVVSAMVQSWNGHVRGLPATPEREALPYFEFVTPPVVKRPRAKKSNVG